MTKLLPFLLIGSIVSLPYLVSCQSVTKKEVLWNKEDTFWLKSSVYSGPFYGHPKINIISTQPLSTLQDAKTVDGYVIRLNNSNDIIPAGTMAKIVKIEEPSKNFGFLRPIYTPKENIWVYLKLGKNRGNTTIFHQKEFVIVIPKIVSLKDVPDYLRTYLTRKDNNGWILTQEKNIQASIYTKKPLVGMNKEQVKYSLGLPLKIEKIKSDFSKGNDGYVEDEVWYYHRYILVFSKDNIAKISSINV